jgi:hypothetical protein
MKTIRKKPVQKKHEAIVNNAPKLHASFEPGDVAHQGDLIFVAIHSLPASAKPRANRQLADGSTQGSRHVMTRGAIYDCSPDEVVAAIKKVRPSSVVTDKFIGPVFVSPDSPTENDLTHPEHGHHGFPAGAVCAVVVQRNLDSEEREQRAAD